MLAWVVAVISGAELSIEKFDDINVVEELDERIRYIEEITWYIYLSIYLGIYLSMYACMYVCMYVKSKAYKLLAVKSVE
jgi:hypothetical protein